MSEWQTIDSAPRDVVINTKIDGSGGPRNIQKLIARQRNSACRVMWFLPDESMYVYYSPTHWQITDEQP